MSEGDYELQKQIAIKDALLADWELKNRVLRESMSSHDKLRGDLEERLAVQKGVYEAKLKKLDDNLVRGEQMRSDMGRQIIQLQELNIKELKEHEQQVSELNDRIATQDTVIEDLTNDNQRLTLDVGKGVEAQTLLRKQILELQHRGKVLDKLEKVLDIFE